MVTSLRLEKRKRILEPDLQTAYDFLRAHIEWAGSAIWLEVLLLVLRLLPSADND
jgi:hypothetical protein